MARLYTIGWETGSVNEPITGLTATVTGDNLGVVTSPAHSGAYAFKVDYSTTASTGGRAAQFTLGGGPTNTLFSRFYLYITALPTERSAVFRTNSVSTGVGTRGSVSLNTDGSVQVYNGSTAVGSASSALALNTWYRIEVSSISDGANQTMTLMVDGTTVASGASFANTNADSTTLQLGWSATGTAGPTKSGTYYIDDFAVNYEGGGGQTSFPGAANTILLLPVADSAIGTGWTTSGAATTNLYANLDNTPPTGIADTTTNEDHQIRNATSTANSDYDAQVADYVTAGIAAADTINYVNIVLSTGAPSATSPKTGSVQIVSNPAGTLTSIGNFYSGAVAGTYPTGWTTGAQASGAGVTGDIATVNRSTRPVIRIRQVTSSTRIAMVTALGLYVDYTPAPTTSTSIALVGTPTTAVGSSITATTASVTVPTGSTGDLLVFYVSTSAVSGTAGASAITSATAGLTQLYSFTGNSFLAAKLLYRFVQGGDPTSYTFTINVGAPLAVVCARYSGVSSTTPFRFLNANKSPAASGAVITSAFAALDNVQPTDLVLAAAAMGTSVSNTTQADALSTPTGWANVVTQVGPTNAVTSSTHTALALYSRQNGTGTPSPTGSTGGYAIVSIALIEATAQGAPRSGSPIGFVNAASTGGTAGATSIVVNVPSGTVDGNLMLAAAASANGLNGWAPPSGWTPLMLSNAWTNAGTSSNIGDCDARLFYRFASSEPASYTFTVVNSATLVAAIMTYAGIRTPYPIYIDNVTATEGSGVTATTTSPSPYDLSTMNSIVANGLVVNVYVAGGDASGLVSLTAPSSPWNTRVNMASNRAGGFNIAIAAVDKVAAADEPTATANVASGWVVYSLALTAPPFLRGQLRGPNYRR